MDYRQISDTVVTVCAKLGEPLSETQVLCLVGTLAVYIEKFQQDKKFGENEKVKEALDKLQNHPIDINAKPNQLKEYEELIDSRRYPTGKVGFVKCPRCGNLIPGIMLKRGGAEEELTKFIAFYCYRCGDSSFTSSNEFWQFKGSEEFKRVQEFIEGLK